MSQAVKNAELEHGPVNTWELGPSGQPQKAAELILPYLKTSKICGTGTGCIGRTYKTLHGANIVWGDQSHMYKAKLQNGMTVSFVNPGDTSCQNKKSCIQICIDVNGAKEPNTLGIDAFWFRDSPVGLIPSTVNLYPEAYSTESDCRPNSTRTNNGALCAGWVVWKGNMDYLRRDVWDEW